jgi:transcriptional regulator with XRE-family HTH domain
MKQIMKQPDLGEYIATLRKEQGLTQEELVEKCNINVRTIQRIEAGDVTPRSYTIKNILEALGSSFEEITQELHRTSRTVIENENLLVQPKNGLLIGILGILYIIISIPLAFADISAAIGGERIFHGYLYTAVAVMYLLLLCGFYGSLSFALKTPSNLLKSCVFIFLGLEILSTAVGFYWYASYYSDPDGLDIALAIGFQIIYGISLIVLAVPFYYARNQFPGIFKNLGLIIGIAGACHLTFILFPFGILGTLLFEILLIGLMFKYYQAGKEVVE